MAYFAKAENGFVVQVVSIPDKHESRGQDYLNNDLGLSGVWLQTSYNTRGGVHMYLGEPIRKNYAGVGYTYDETRDAFIPPKPYPSWLLNEDSCLWEPPVKYPADGQPYSWDEESLSWVVEPVLEEVIDDDSESDID